MCYCYIIYSIKLDRYYVGSTCDDLNERLRRHNSNHKGFTGKANDWNFVYIEEFESTTTARKRERQIKTWKSRKMILELISSSK